MTMTLIPLMRRLRRLAGPTAADPDCELARRPRYRRAQGPAAPEGPTELPFRVCDFHAWQVARTVPPPRALRAVLARG